MIRVNKWNDWSHWERIGEGFFPFFGHTKISLYKHTFPPITKNRPLVQKKCSLDEQAEKHMKFDLWRARKWASKTGCTMSWEAVWRDHFVWGAIQKVRWKRPSPTLPARHAIQTQFFLNLTSGIESLGGYPAFPMLEQFMNYVVVVEQRYSSKTVYWPRRSRARPRLVILL